MDTLEFRTIKFLAFVGWIQAPIFFAIEMFASRIHTICRFAPGDAFKFSAFKPVAFLMGASGRSTFDISCLQPITFLSWAGII